MNAVSDAGGLDFITDGKTVVLKPNLLTVYQDNGETIAPLTSSACLCAKIDRSSRVTTGALDPNKVPHPTLLVADGLGTIVAARINVVGAQVATVETPSASRQTEIGSGNSREWTARAGLALVGLLIVMACKARGGIGSEASADMSPSCKALAATCGAPGNDDCCRTLLIPGGTFNRGYDGVLYKDADYPATVSDFYLDKYEITVGRFRAFVWSGGGTQKSPPAEGAGAHGKVADSGWSSRWNAQLAVDAAALNAALKCDPVYGTWTDTPGTNESKPIECLDWYLAFAFCAWDGGRLPTYAEWNYAASGGSEHRYYPWSVPANSEALDDSYAVYCGGTCLPQNVGSKSPKGDGKWGQADLGGNAWEWTLDWSPKRYALPCDDCAEVTEGAYRVFLGGSNNDIDSTMLSASRHVSVPEYRGVIGARCARAR